MADSIFDRPLENKYHEEAPVTDFEAFRKVVESRRSIRVYEDRAVPDEVVRECLRLALLAPTSSNLQCWEFHWVKHPETKAKLAKACFGQPAATTAPVLIVAVARPNLWRKHAKEMAELLEGQGAPKAAISYYKKLVPAAYGLMGPFGVLSPVKWLVINLMGLFQVMPRDPMSPWGLKTWAHKTVALACENLMLAFRAAGYDTCPMEGFDERRVKHLLKLPRGSSVTMVISAGRRAVGGVYGARVRFPESRFLIEYDQAP